MRRRTAMRPACLLRCRAARRNHAIPPLTSCSGSISPSSRFEPVWRDARGLWVECQPMLQWRKGAAAAIGAIAQAGKTSRCPPSTAPGRARRHMRPSSACDRLQPMATTCTGRGRPTSAPVASPCAQSTDRPCRPAIPRPAPAPRQAGRMPCAPPSADTNRHSARTESPRRRSASIRCPPDRRAGRRTAHRAHPAVATWTTDGTPARTTRQSAPPAPQRHGATCAPRRGTRRTASAARQRRS